MPYDPFRLGLPAAVAFSGGRTSGYMLHRIAAAHRAAGLPLPWCLFCNTGKERPETLDFVERCSLEWGVPIVWLEYRWEPGRHYYAVVNYATASRKGEPFDLVIQSRSFLPNRVARYCTADLKVRTMRRYLKDLGLEHYTKAVGLRVDEPGRVLSIMAGSGHDKDSAEEIVCPLHEAGIDKRDVMAYWAASPFDLQLLPHEGNCDLCFLKRRGSILEIMSRRPDLAAWWLQQEARGPDFIFRSINDRPRYKTLLQQASEPSLFPLADDDEDDIPCSCTD